MIREQEVLMQLNVEWEAVEEMLKTARWSWTEVEVAPSVLDLSRDLAVAASNLCVLFAMAVLERTLLQLRDEKVFISDRSSLSNLMLASKNYGLPWMNYDLVDEIRTKRNAIAHKQTKFSEYECMAMVLAVKSELESWSIIKTKL
ncbi:hypothetical protein KJ068_28390 [bacterium]|nr:hypothetical protein [bacterium]